MTSRRKTSPDGAKKLLLAPSQLTNSLGEMTPNVEASCPETNVISLEHRANRAMFQNKPAAHASSEWCEFPSGVRSAFRRRTTDRPIVVQTGRTPHPQDWKREGSIEPVPGIYVYVQNKPGKGGDAECGAEGGVEGPPRLVLPSRLRLSVINLIEALSLLDCGSKRERERERRRG